MTTLSNSERLVKQEVLRELIVEMGAALYRYFDDKGINENDTSNPLVLLQMELRDEPDKLLLAKDEDIVRMDGYINYLYQFLKKIGVV